MAPASAFLAPPHALPTRERALRPSPVRPLVTPLLPVATAASSPSDRPRERGRPEQRGRRAGGRSNDPGAHRRNRRATMSAPPVPRVEDVLVGGGIAVAGVVAATAMGGAADAIHSLPAVGDSFELVRSGSRREHICCWSPVESCTIVGSDASLSGSSCVVGM